MTAIRTFGLTKQYGDLVAVDDLDLVVEEGEVFGFLGPNGAGKSTTIKCLLALIQPSAGRAEILGLDTADQSLEVRRRVGFLPGDLALYPKLTGREMVEYLANLRGGVEPNRIDALADRFDADLSRRCGEYSSGNRQKVGLIQAFMHDPDLVILDEPSTGLDPLVQQSLHELIVDTAESGRTVFLSSHTLSEVERVAGRVGIIRHGRLVEVSAMDDLRAKAIRRIEIEFDADVDPAEFRDLDRVRAVDASDHHLTITFEGPVDQVLNAATSHGVRNLRTREADLEEIFLTYYRDEEADDGSDRDAQATAGSSTS